MIRGAISTMVDGGALDADTAYRVMGSMMRGEATDAQIASLVTAMRMRGETEDEVYGFAKAMRDSCGLDAFEGAVDLCGTGGDRSGTFNISTTASFVACAAGATVVKHGNRSVSSLSGSSDVLSALCIPYDLGPNSVRTCIRGTGIGFMHAPSFHSSMSNVMGARREIGIRTVFNLLGPLANPLSPRSQLMGVSDPSRMGMLSRVLGLLGVERSLVVHGCGLDEMTVSGTTDVIETLKGRTLRYTVEPEDLDLERAPIEALKGGDPRENARIMLSILRGERSPRGDVVAMNAGAALYVAGESDSMEEGVAMSRGAIEDGSAYAKLKEFADTCVSLERREQLSSRPEHLLSRRPMADVLVKRCRELSRTMMERIDGMGLGGHMDNLDPLLLDEPDVLTYIVLRRLMSHTSYYGDRLPRSERPMSESISSAEGVAVIGEYKPTSPTAMPLRVPPSPESAVDAYGDGGVAAMSVLAEPELFGGGPDLFSSIRRMTGMPMLYKDFVVTEGQLDVAKDVGADAVLLIAAALSEHALDDMVQGCLSRGMEPLVEIHTSRDVSKLSSISSKDLVDMVGINSRDLRTLKVDLDRPLRMRDSIDTHIRIAESGIRTPCDVKGLRGFDAVLVGTMFMSSPTMADTARELVSLCREVCA